MRKNKQKEPKNPRFISQNGRTLTKFASNFKILNKLCICLIQLLTKNTHSKLKSKLQHLVPITKIMLSRIKQIYYLRSFVKSITITLLTMLYKQLLFTKFIKNAKYLAWFGLKEVIK